MKALRSRSRAGARLVAALALSLSTFAFVAPAAAQEIRLPEIREITLPNGARVLLAERHDVPLVAFSAYLKGGSLTDPEGKEGVASLTTELLRKGAGKRSAVQIAEAVDGVGGALSTGSFLEGFYVTGEFLSQDTDVMLDLMRSVLREPVFADSEFTKLREQTVESIKAEKDDPQSVYRA
jgi:predicted Zn-dependent peptidase